MRLNALDTIEPYAKPVFMRFTEADQPQLQINLKARIGLLLEIAPAVVELPTPAPGSSGSPGGPGGGPTTQSTTDRPHVTITNHGKTPAKLIYATSTNPAVVVPVGRQPIGPGQSVYLPIQVTNPTAFKAGADTTVTLHTDVKDQPTLSVCVKALK